MSVDRTEYRQTVLVTSKPEGAVIYDRNQKIGITPSYVRVRRRHHPELTLEYPGEEKRKIPLKTHYRWGDSFGMNFLFLTAAPLGWGVDFATGNAWRLDDPPETVFSAKANKTKAESIPVVAIAPPDTGDRDVADAIGPLLQNKLYGAYTILPYEKTAPLFSYYGSEQGLSTNQAQRYNLFYELPADKILLTKAEPSGEGYLVQGRLRDRLTGEESKNYSWEVSPGDGNLKEEFTTHRTLQRFFHILPNTLFLSFSQYQSTLNINQVTYNGKARVGGGFNEEALQYLSAISLEHLDRPRASVRGHWTYEFVPTVNLSKKKIVFDTYSPIKNIEFDRWYASTGYGFELGHQSRIGLFYLDVIPTVTWTQLSFTKPNGDEKISHTAITATTELGYSYFLTSHLVGKLFVRNLAEDLSLWEIAMRDVTGHDDTITGVKSIFTGISIGYYIPSSLARREGWKVTSH